MNRNLVLIFTGISIFILLLFIGFPLEFIERNAERIARVIISISVVLCFIKLFQISRKLNSKRIRISTAILITLVSVPYFFICVYNLSTAFSSNYRRWKDISVYENSDGKKISYQLRETSGSMYDYRYRRIFYENKSFRVSVNCDFGKETGWSVKKID